MYNRTFKNANEAFVILYRMINLIGIDNGNSTKAVYNTGFILENPLENLISEKERKWSHSYAKREFEWYMSQNRSVEDLKKYAPIWDKMHTGDNIVNSNYGFLWNENGQLKKTIKQLKNNNSTRQAWITLFDGKRKDDYVADTPCTLNIGFRVLNGRLNMSILMRSCDLWFGFCNDQYCFSNLQKLVAHELKIPVGIYYHYADDLHIYEQHYDREI